MALTPSPRIPLDIAELIIDQWDSFDTLRAYALTCRSFLGRARRHLFRVVYLYYYALGMKIYQQLLDALESSPELAQYVRKLFIDEKFVRKLRLVTHPSLPGMIHTFKNLDSFRLGFDGDGWNDLPNDLKHTILSLKIRKLFLADVHNLPRGLSNFIMNIEAVHLISPSFETQEDSSFPRKLLVSRPQDIMPLKILRLARISMRDSQTFVEDLLSLNYTLVTLSLIVADWNENDDTFDIGLKMINKHYRSLTTLYLYFATATAVESKDVISRLDIGALPHLQIFDMKLFSTPNSLNTAQRILSKVRQQNEMRELSLGFSCTRLSDSNTSSWTDLDILLSRPEFARLQMITFDFLASETTTVDMTTNDKPFYYYEPLGFEDQKVEIDNALPMLLRRGNGQLYDTKVGVFTYIFKHD